VCIIIRWLLGVSKRPIEPSLQSENQQEKRRIVHSQTLCTTDRKIYTQPPQPRIEWLSFNVGTRTRETPPCALSPRPQEHRRLTFPSHRIIHTTLPRHAVSPVTSPFPLPHLGRSRLRHHKTHIHTTLRSNTPSLSPLRIRVRHLQRAQQPSNENAAPYTVWTTLQTPPLRQRVVNSRGKNSPVPSSLG
jgi:hypothetical protein